MARTRKTRRISKTEILIRRLFPEPQLASIIPKDTEEETTNIFTQIDVEGGKYSTFVDGQNGYLYAIPAMANHVLKFHVQSQTFTFIGPDLSSTLLGHGIHFPHSWICGILAPNNGYIYCPTAFQDNYPDNTQSNTIQFLKISTLNDDDVTILHFPLSVVPELGGQGSFDWKSGVLAKDDHMYFMPSGARRILQLNPYTEKIKTVGGRDLEGTPTEEQNNWYSGTVLGSDGYIYGIPHYADLIVKFCPSSISLSSNDGCIAFVERAKDSSLSLDHDVRCFYCGNGVLVDGCIYALSSDGSILKIDLNENHYKWNGQIDTMFEAGDPIVGADHCIYWPPAHGDASTQILKFDPTNPNFCSGNYGNNIIDGNIDCNIDSDKYISSLGGVLANDGVIYCPPFYCNHILTIDPFNTISRPATLSPRKMNNAKCTMLK